MTFARGAALTTSTSLGHADTSDLGPTAGNGFYKRWPHDLARLQEIGVTDLRLTLDWARLQPKPGALAPDWVEHFQQILAAADAIDLHIWATLHDGDIPKWVANEGGLDDDAVAMKWWPRFVERVADTFGSNIVGWVPFAEISNHERLDAWANTWAILCGGDGPVVASLTAADTEHIPAYLEISDRVGLVMTHPEVDDPEPDDEHLVRVGEAMRETLHRVREFATETELAVTHFSAVHDDADVAARIVEEFVGAVDDEIDDGADIGIAFLDPAISGPDSVIGLLDADRSASPTASAYLPHSSTTSTSPEA